MNPAPALRRPALFATLVVALMVGCDGGTEPARPVVVTSVDTLRPGQVAQVRGSGLTNLKSVMLDGVAATELVSTSDTVAQFRVPSMRECETDMRAVQLAADDADPIGGVVRVPPSITLGVAESRVLTADDLECLQLPGADHDYVLSAASTVIPTTENEALRPLVSVRVFAAGNPGASLATSDASALRASFTRDAGALLEPDISGQAPLTSNYSQAPVQFDPDYATAVVGDTLDFVDWFSGAAQICQQSAATVPSFKAKVVAIAGQVVVVADLRQPVAGAFLNAPSLAWLHNSAAVTDELLLPTMRSIFDPDYVPLAGGGGRFFVVLGNVPGLPGFAGFAYDGPLGTANIFPQSSCPRSSEMVVSTVNAQVLSVPQNQTVSFVSGLFLHEYAHSADFITSGRGKTSSILNEGLATLAEETASRIATGQPLGARHILVGSDAPAITGGALGLWGTQPQLGPWQFNGRYGRNARMLMFLRELAGEASVNHGRKPTLYQRLIYAPIDWLDRPSVIGLITSELDIEYADLIDRETLASVTAGLIAPGVVHTLPRYTSWDHTERAIASGPRSDGFAGRASRRTNGDYGLGAADGGHAALYLMADGPRGASLELLSIAQVSRIIRLTRLR